MRIFLGSTYVDLEPYREALEALVHEYGEMFIGMEHFGARSNSALETCLTEVSSSDIVIALVGDRYGTQDAATGKSFTQLEVEQAQRCDIPVLVFVKDKPDVISKAEMARRNAFVKWLGSRYTYAHFGEVPSLVAAIAAALRRFEMGTVDPDDSGVWKEIVDRAGTAADWDCIALTAHNVDHLHSVDLVAADYETRVGDPVKVPGGSGANTVSALGRLGLRVGAAGLVGDDNDGLLIKASLEADNVTPLLASARGLSCRTGVTTTFTDAQGQRSIYVSPGANEHFAAKAKNNSYRARLRAAIGSSRIIHFSSFTKTPERGLQESLLADIPEKAILSFTPGSLYCKLGLDRLTSIMQRTNVLFLYEKQLDMLIGRNEGRETTDTPLEAKLARLYEWKHRRSSHEPLAVVIKNTSGNSATVPHLLSGTVGRVKADVYVPTQASSQAQPTTPIRDSTGAGDACAAGFLWGILHRKSVDHSLDIAYVLARSAGGEYGGRAGLPTWPQLRSRWRSWVGSPHPL